MKLYKHVLMVGVAGCAALMSSPALAEAADADTDNTIEAIIVTAAKRAQDVQDVPISMNVVAQEKLEAFNTADLKGLSASIPSMMVLRTNSINTISLRGFGSSSANPAIDQTVALYTDGIFAGRARQYMAPFFDVARVEVLRGPQGALLGKNTAAGAVSIVTNNPTDSFEGSVTASYLFDRNGVDTFGYVSGPIADKLKARLSFKYINDEGWVLNRATGKREPQQDSYNLRLGLTWTPTEDIEVITKLQYDHLNVDGRGMAGFLASIPKDIAMQPVKTASGLNGQRDYDNQRGYHASTTATVDLGELTFVSITGYEGYHSDSVASASHADPVNFQIRFRERFKQISQEVRLLSPTGGRFDWIVGAYADQAWHDINNPIRYLGRFAVLNLDGQMTSRFDQDATSLSAYGTGTWHVTDQLRVIGGVRWSQVKKDGNYVFVRDFGQNFVGAAPVGPLVGSLSDEHLDPSVTVQYDVAPQAMVYAGYSRGSKGGTFQGANRSVTAATFELKPEESTNYEVGLKLRAFNWLTFDAAIYRLEFKNLQAGQYVNGVLLTKNAGAARSQGVEVVAGGDWEFFRVSLSGAYNDAKYTDYPGASCTQAQINAGCVNGVTPVNGAGRTFAFVPKWSGQASATWWRPVGDKMKVSLTGAVQYSSSYFVDSGTFNPFFGLQDAYAKIDLRAELADIDERWSVAIVGKNVGDKITSSGVYPWPFATPPLAVYTLDEPKSWAIQGTYRF